MSSPWAEGLAANPAHPFALAKVTLEEGSVPSGFEAVAVKLNLRELTAGTTYEAVLVAENANGRTTGAPVAFTTTGAPPAEGTGPEPEIPGPAPLLSPFPTAALMPVLAYNPIPPAETTSTGPPAKHLTKKQLLAKALKACNRKPKRQRAACRRQAKRKYR